MPTLPHDFLRRDLVRTVNSNQSALEDTQADLATLTTKNAKQGTATITNPLTSVTVTHNYGSTSYIVSVIPQQDIGSGRRFWVDTKNANDFALRVDAALGSNMTFEWILRGT